MSFENSRIEQAKTEHEILLEDKISAAGKRRQEKRRRRKLKFSNKHHAKEGIISTVLALLGIALIASAVALSVSLKGQGERAVGLMPFFALLMSTAGIILSCITFKRPDTIYTFSWIGLAANIAVWLFVAILLVIGA